MAAVLTLAAFFSHVTLSMGCDYTTVAGFRDADVALNFDPAKMEGLWYEHGYSDPAQVGASCQTLNGTYDEASGTLNTDFSVDYQGGHLPFTIKEHYVPHNLTDPSMKAVYRKSVSAPFNIPGGSLVGLTTSMVKTELSSDRSRYESVVMYSCLLFVNELVIATRSPIISDSEYQSMVDDLKKKGIPAASSLSRVDWSKCKTAQAAVVV